MNTNQQKLSQIYNEQKNNPCSPLIVDGNHNIVFGEGNPNALLMFVGEAPGRDEDIQGRPFVGRAGKLLDKALKECNLNRSDVYITNIIKTRPLNNRTPNEQEIKNCWPILKQQIDIIQPKIICTLGASATTAFLKKAVSMSKIHGFAIPYENTIVVPVYHPAYILRDPRRYTEFLDDIQFVAKTTKNIEK